MSIFSKLFGGKSQSKAPQPETHAGFLIFPEPKKESGGFRLSARIEKEINGEVKTHLLIRADSFHAADTAAEAAVTKAKMLIDQMGEKLFG